MSPLYHGGMIRRLVARAAPWWQRLLDRLFRRNS